jgi:hypothetical protein
MALMDLPNQDGWQFALAPLAGWPDNAPVRTRCKRCSNLRCVSSRGGRGAKPCAC